MKKIKLGDIFEISTPKGFAYLHYIYKDPTIGELVRILPELYTQRPANIEKLAGLKERFMVFFPLAAAHKMKIVEKVGSYPAIEFTKPKLMRTQHEARGVQLGWHIVNTDTWTRELVAELNEEQIKLSPWGVWNDTLLIDHLSNNWKLEDWR